jgi:hypothetical protein
MRFLAVCIVVLSCGCARQEAVVEQSPEPTGAKVQPYQTPPNVVATPQTAGSRPPTKIARDRANQLQNRYGTGEGQ